MVDTAKYFRGLNDTILDAHRVSHVPSFKFESVEVYNVNISRKSSNIHLAKYSDTPSYDAQDDAIGQELELLHYRLGH